MVHASEGPTLSLLNYSREASDSRRGTVLLPHASFHLGAPITRLQRISWAGGGAAAGAAAGVAARRNGLLWASTDGSIGFVAPLSESDFRRLAFLATKMAVGLPQPAGLHPRAFRADKTRAASARELKNMVDGQLMGRFLELSAEDQQRLAMQIGSTPRNVFTALVELLEG